MASSSTNLTMKLLIDAKHEKVLFNLLCLPIGTVVRLLTKNGMVGCLGNLYDSVENLSDTYMQPNLNKDVLLNPTTLISSTGISRLLTTKGCNVGDNPETSKSYSTGMEKPVGFSFSPSPSFNKRDNLFGSVGFGSPNWTNTATQELPYVGNKTAEVQKGSINGGFVKEVVTYMVMDDLVIQPMSSISSITLLNKFNVREIGALQERVVKLGMEEGINLLKASLQSKMVLTSTFLKNLESQGLE